MCLPLRPFITGRNFSIAFYGIRHVFQSRIKEKKEENLAQVPCASSKLFSVAAILQAGFCLLENCGNTVFQGVVHLVNSKVKLDCCFLNNKYLSSSVAS